MAAKIASRLCLHRVLTKSIIRPSHIVAPNRFSTVANTFTSPPAGFTVQKRCYSHGPPMSRESFGDRILLVLKLYDKVNPEQLTLESRFKEDLGLDSLDKVEVIMAIEDEFGFEIPDKDAEYLKTPALVVQYIMDKFDVMD